MKKVLAFCFFPAFVPPSNGGEVRLFNFYRALSQWCHVTLLTSTHIGVAEETIKHGVNFIERRIPKDDFFVHEYRRLQQYSAGGDLSGPALAACGSRPTLWHQAYLGEYEKADVIFHDFPFSIDYDIFAGLDDKPRIYNSHNCETLLYQQLHPTEKAQIIHKTVRGAEQRALNVVDLVLYCNEDDLSAFRDIAPNAQYEAMYVPHGMSPHGPERKEPASRSGPCRAVFMGSGHPPNAKAAEFVAFTLAPALPQVQFDVVGSCLPPGNYPSNVKRHGVVDHATKAKILSHANIALNPMAEGSGSNVKVLEYFAYGLPVLSTAFGMRGIRARPELEYFQASPEDFAVVLEAAVRESDALVAVGERGKALALKAYTWEAIIAPVVGRLESLKSSDTVKADRRVVLALNDYDPFKEVGGGSTRTRGLYEAVQAWAPVVLCCFSKDDTLTVTRYAEKIVVIAVPKTSAHLSDLTWLNSQFHVSVDDIIASRHCLSNPWLNAVYRVLRQVARCVVIEHCYLVDLPIYWGDRLVYSSQNNETLLKGRLLQGHPHHIELSEEVERLERLAVECSAATIAVSHEDAASLVKGKCTAGPIVVVRNGATMPALGEALEESKKKIRDRVAERSVIFLGSAHMPNVEAAKFIVEHLALKCPEVDFHLVGSVCDSILKPPSNVRLWGVVDELTKCAILQSCALAVNPMEAGSGSNVKLADYLGNGLFVLTTEFGLRGYPESVNEHLVVAPRTDFVEQIKKLVGVAEIFSFEARASRSSLFESELAMRGLGSRFVATLQSLEQRKIRVLYVAYRYAAPALGGAEVNVEKFVRALGATGDFHVDVVSPEVTGIRNHLRFSESYTFDGESGVPVDIPNVRFARFPADRLEKKEMKAYLQKAWNAQPDFEKALDRQFAKKYLGSGLTWGWGYPEGEGETAVRWAFTGCGLFLAEAAQVEVYGYAISRLVVTIYSEQHILAGPLVVEGDFHFAFEAQQGRIEFNSSVPVVTDDPRPLSFKAMKILIGGGRLDLSATTLLEQTVRALPSDEAFNALDQAAADSRFKAGVHLTDGRGPWSAGLESFIRDQVANYDLVVAHNSVFRPATIAMNEARMHGVPAVLVPHAHLDDDFYHFPDVLKAAQDASLVLTAPQAATDFLRNKGCNVQYMPAGCDIAEQFTDADREAFQKVYNSKRQFVLVLGRKAGAKGYRKIIDAVERLNREGFDLRAVLIGPDDDGVAVTSNNAVYLGRQPRDVVRGALLSCVALVNMSSSESFGIVLLEAWLAGKPVIANVDCVAFHDMAVDGENSLLVSPDNVASAIATLLAQPDLRVRLAKNGRKTAEIFDWNNVVAKFVSLCEELVRSRRESRDVAVTPFKAGCA